MKLIMLSPLFYETYKNCPEIEKKQDRPYIQLIIELDGITFAAPFRSNIPHQFAFFTDKKNRCGIDFSKSVVITDPAFISDRRVHLRDHEYDALLGKDYEIVQGLKSYISRYRKAAANRTIPRNDRICRFSTLQYFEDLLGISQENR